MTLSTQSSAATYLGNGATTQWAFDFPIMDLSHLQLKTKDATGALNNIAPADYQVVGIGSPTGGYVAYPLSGNPVPPGWRVRVQRVVPLVQPVEIINQEAFYPEVIESAADYGRFIDQQMTQRLIDLEANDLWV
jgi:hypothetical protein